LTHNNWDALEARIIQAFGGDIEITPMRPFSNEFRDASGKWWRTLNWNDQKGTSEDGRSSGVNRFTGTWDSTL
jgi:hypothetical protein